MKKVLQELFWVHFFGHPYCSNGTKIHLDAALHEDLVYLQIIYHYACYLKYTELKKPFWPLSLVAQTSIPASKSLCICLRHVFCLGDVVSINKVYETSHSKKIFHIRRRVD